MVYSLEGAFLKSETLFLCSTVTLQDGTAVDSSQDTVEVRYFGSIVKIFDLVSSKIYDLKHGEKFVRDILSSLKGNDRDLLNLNEASPEEENVQNK